MAPLVIILCMVICSHTLIFVDHQPTCGPQLGSYGLFYSVFLIVIGGVLPNFLLVLFGFWTIRNVKASRRRVVALQYLQHKQKRDAQLVLMIFAQAIVSFLLNSTRMSCYSYHLLTTNRPNSSFQQTVDNFLVQFSIVLAYTNYSESFYINTLMKSTTASTLTTTTTPIVISTTTTSTTTSSETTPILNTTSRTTSTASSVTATSAAPTSTTSSVITESTTTSKTASTATTTTSTSTTTSRTTSATTTIPR
ncbi:unnamed protein product [Adineta steineri]|uniref:G-protein coupled receptors family 1 profile domain-containing protein n=1 Tax=Adineta steineri TaxID=433720 RepID=A0A815BG58_9BILA|nr:unnamed protein product [Adineta steineri]